MITRRKVLVTGAAVAAGGALAACSRGNGKGGGTATGTREGRAAEGAKVTVTPAADSRDVVPGAPVTVVIEGGTLAAVTVTGGGKALAGELDAERRRWTSSGNLAYGQQYTVSVTGTDDSGGAVERNSGFTTLKPAGTAQTTFQANPMLALKNGGTYGVGQPVIVYFNKAVKDPEAAERAMTVTAEPAVEGRWHWVSGQSAHWRPEKYWATGTKVRVTADLLGVDLGGGVYGAANSAASFSIGPSRIAIADSDTHQMECWVDGRMVRRIPISMGKGGGTTGSKGEPVDFYTRSGVHVLMTKEPLVTMSSETFGITDKNNPNYYVEQIRLACRISLSGEYVHMADWNIPSQGRANTSHGCVNVGPANAQWFYDTFDVGDVVEVRNTPKNLTLTDGLGDWNLPWGQW